MTEQPERRKDTADLDAVRSVDPASTHEPSAALRERIAAIPSTSDTAPIVTVRRRSRWIAPAAASVALAVAVGGGYLLGAHPGNAPVSPGASGVVSSVAPGPTVAVATGTSADPAAPVSLGGSAGGGAREAVTDESQSLTMSAGISAASGTVSPWHYSNGRRFTLPTFDSVGSTAKVYALDGRAQYSAADAERIASALGIDGTAHQKRASDGWIVGNEKSGRAPTLWLWPSGGGDVDYQGGIGDPYTACWEQVAPRFGDAKGLDLTREQRRERSAQVDACVENTPMPTKRQAREAMSLFLAATRVDESATQVTVTSDKEWRTMSVSAARVVDGNETVVTSWVTVSAKGILYAHGPTAPVESLGEYPIVSPAEAADRLNDPVYAPAYAAKAASEVDYRQHDDPATEPPALPAAGAKVPWGITEFEISSARLGLALMTSIRDERFLAPAYEFTDTEGNVWSVLALAESEIDPVGGGDGRGWWGWGY